MSAKFFFKRTQEKWRGDALEKQTIIDEVFEETLTRMDETAEIKIENIMDFQKTLDVCQKCSQPLDEVYCRSEHMDCFFDLVVFKCPSCKSFLAYWVEESDRYSTAEPPEEGSNPTDHSFPLEHSNPKKIPKKCAMAYSKTIATIESKHKELNSLIQTKLPQLCKAGLSLATINFARNKVTLQLQSKNPAPKSLAKLVAGAVYATANGVTWEGSSLWKHQGEGITEEKLEEIFGVTRKTICKWAKVF